MIKKIWNDPVGSQVIGFLIIAVLTSIGALIYSLVVSIPYLQVWTSIYETKISVVYVFLTIVFIMVFRAYLKRVVRKSKSSLNQITKPTYTKDKFGPNQTTWSWELLWNQTDNAWEIRNLSPHCRLCETKTDLKNDYGYAIVYCAKCDLEGKRTDNSLKESYESVSKAIIRRNNEGEAKQIE